MFDYTVVGGNGFIGSEFVNYLTRNGKDVFVPLKNDTRLFEQELGTVIYCAGEGDCSKNFFNVVEANTILLKDILQKASFSKLVYISSTRLYMNQLESMERCDLKVTWNDGRKLFNLTKLISEELCLKSEKNCLIVRPSNVYGVALSSSLFLPSITRNAILNNQVDMYVNPDYAKDYVSVNDVVKATLCILDADVALPKIINIASGKNTTAKEIADILEKETGCTVHWHEVKNHHEIFPETDISELRKVINFELSNVIIKLKEMIAEFKVALK